jgi:EAL domain-containing protein (putative c-di-GMP-specific phosphodiesterase class I)
MPRQLNRAAELIRSLPDAVQRGEIAAAFQPQFLVSSAKIVAVETLSRWHHPTLGMVLPHEFIPIAEGSNLISEVGDRMIELATQAAAIWQRATPSLEVAINISLHQLRDRDFAARFVRMVSAASADIRTMIIEVTESARAEDVPGSAENLRALVDAGVTISVDDFGSGFSSEEQVAALPATELKVDLHLVQDTSSAGHERLADVVRFGQQRKMRVVAEGVESAEQLAAVRELGCDRAQGFLLARPASINRVEALLAAQA